MPDTVVGMRGVVLPGQADADLVAELERMLAEAQAGTLIGLAWSTVVADGSPGHAVGVGWTGAAGTRWAIGAGVLLLQHRYAHRLLESG